MNPQIDRTVRVAIYDGFSRDARALSRDDVAERTGLTRAEVDGSYERLAAGRVLVLAPGTGEVWMAMPFSAVPTDVVVTDGVRSWWANCAWDALGVAAATGREVSVSSHCPDCDDRIEVRVAHGRVTSSPAGAVGHFAVPAANWWDDIGFT